MCQCVTGPSRPRSKRLSEKRRGVSMGNVPFLELVKVTKDFSRIFVNFREFS